MNALLDSAAAVTGWMVFSLMIGGVVIVAALAAHDAQRAANRSVRWVWMAAIGVIVALSLAAPLRQQPASARVPLSLSASTDAAAAVSYPRLPARHVMVTALLRARDAVITPITVALQQVEGQWWRLPGTFHRAVLVTWMLTAIIALGVLALSYLRVRRRVQHWPVQDVAGVSARIAPMAGPAVVGLAPSEIVLPAWLLGRPVGEQRLVLAHETEHVRAGDPWLLVLACTAVAVMPWHPALWFAFGRLRLAVELDCDRRVLQRGVPRSDYGTLLIDLSALRRTLPSAMPAFSCNGSYLERRLVAMTSGRTRFALARRIGGGLLAAVALATACSSELPTSAEVEKMDVAAAEKRATRLMLMDTGSTRYVLDGKAVSRDLVMEVRADNIASVEVARGQGRGMDEVRIVRRRMMADTLVAASGMKFRVIADSGQRTIPDSPSADVNRSEFKRTFDGLLVIDNKITNPTLLNGLDPATIEKVEVIKGAAAREQYSDPRAANGVIKVTRKVAKP